MHALDAVTQTNPIIGLVAILLTGFVTFLVTKFTDRAKLDAAGSKAAADQEIIVRAELVTHLVSRVRDLEERVDAASRRERELVERYRVDTEAIEQRYRHLTSSLVFHAAVLRRQLYRAGLKPPEFTGWDKFIEEGGFVREEWVEAVTGSRIAESPRRGAKEEDRC